jgi:uncharacterized protein Veg
MGGGNSSVYACSITAPTGATITLTNTTGQTYSYSQILTQNCQTPTNVNFP